MSPGRATPDQVLTAVQVELALIVKRLIACRNSCDQDLREFGEETSERYQSERFIEMAYHLMGVHLAPERASLRAQALKPIQEIPGDRIIEYQHTIPCSAAL